jgi:hypothetical protein
MTMRFPISLTVALVAGAAALGGCGTTTIDTDKAETEIEKGIEKQTQVKATVACPDDIEAKAKDTFECTATPEGGGGEKATVAVTQTDDEGNITWELK